MAPRPHSGGSSSSEKVVDAVLHRFVKAAALQPGSQPGFSHALKLSYQTIDKTRISVGPRSLTYRYRLSKDVTEYTVGLLSALMDELSTCACFPVGLPSTGGVSLQMQTELAEEIELMDEEEIDVVNIVTKLGRTISFTRTEFVAVRTGQLIAFSSHVKYMPTGSKVADVIWNSPWCSSLWDRVYLQKANASYYDDKPLFQDVIQSHLEFHGMGRATFRCTRAHTNPLGSLHGGCHAMVMEAVGIHFVKAFCGGNNHDRVILQAIQIDFLGAVPMGSVDVICESISVGSGKANANANSTRTTLQIRVLLKRGDRICSDGKLRFALIMNSRL